MAPAGPRVFVQLVPRKLFHFDVQGKRKLSLLPIVFFNRSCLRQPHVPTDCVYTTDNLLSLRRKKNHSIPARRYPR
jgi:hypothetical protein